MTSAPAPLRKLLDELKASETLGGRIRQVETLSARSSRPGPWELSPPLEAVLRGRGIEQLYAHQADALREWQAGNDVLLSTGTNSGKSLVYNLAIGERLLTEPDARALLLFPLKALEHDQLAGLRSDLETLPLTPRARAEIYDGDTAPGRRKMLRKDPPSVLLTTPDMLHAGILASHKLWQEFLTALRLVVIDEVHTYRGVFGAHMAQVLRRLLRVAKSYGASPQFMACSATIGNPDGFALDLLGRNVMVVANDGAPQPLRYAVFVDPETSASTVASRIFRFCVARGLRTIAFTQARRMTELIHTWILEAEPELAPRISSYRSGFLPEERRDIERRLFSGELAGVISTSALEMGIDVGGLDVCLLVGYPGSILATRQRSGRVGRGREGVIFLIPQEDALDRYFLNHPHALIKRPCEEAVLNPGNHEIVREHLPCAAAELPLREDEDWLRQPGVKDALAEAVRSSSLLESAAGGEFFAAARRPWRGVSLRSIGEPFTIRRSGPRGKQVVGTIGASRVYAECHSGAIYLHRADPYLVQHLDLERHEVEVTGPVRVDYYTRAFAEKQTEILEISKTRPLGNALLRLGRLRITSRTTHYEKRRIFGQDLLTRHPLDLPPLRFETEGLWVEIAPEIEKVISGAGGHFMGGIHGMEHAGLALFPLFALCDRFDVAGISIPQHPQVRGPAVFFYDGHPGGVGISRAIYPRLEELLETTREVVSRCDCPDGCPSCIHSPRCGSGNRPLDKRATVRTLELILRDEPLPMSAGANESPPPDRLEQEEPSSPPSVLIFDVETQRSAEEVGGWHNTHLMRLALAVVLDLETGQFETYMEDRVEALIERLFAASLVVGFNIRRFDYSVLRPYTTRDLGTLPTFDLLEDVYQRLGHRLSLDHLAQHTLGRGKSGDGLQSLEWFRRGEIEKVETYCRMDVELVRDLMAFGQREGHVLYRRRSGEIVRLPVDWAVASEAPPDPQRPGPGNG
jgi:DEAD/DEAH box helicase domain-containing protein